MSSPVPVIKVGLVLIAATDASVLVLRPRPKRAGETPPLVLPRGSRQYRTAEGAWLDARDAATACANAATLEPITRTLAREAEEEAGLPPALLQALDARGALRDLGVRLFQSRTQPPYPVHWFTARLTDAEMRQLTPPADALEVRWEPLASIEALATTNAFSPGYIAVIQEALAQWA